MTHRAPRSRRSLVPAILVGFGIGGFVDGIVLHQILQWHHLVSSKVPPDDLGGLQANVLADGLFHQAMWLLVVVGVVLLVRELATVAQPDALRRLAAGVLIGFGLFNVADEIVFHVLLEAHHIRPGPDYLVYDLGFTLWGLVMIVVGAWLLRRGATSIPRR